MFKVGDWVTRSLDNYTIYIDVTVAKIARINNESYVVQLPSGGLVDYNKEHLKLWQPKEGEWCVFSNDPEANKNKFTVAKFHRIAHGQGREGQFRDLSGKYWKHCEPFIGELPSFLKDNK